MQILKQFTVLLIFSGLFGSTPDTLKLNVEPNHSTVAFVVPIAGVTKVRGKFTDFQLYMDYVDGDISKSKARFVIQAKSIDTGIEDRDRHLRSKDFFEVETHPEIVFESTSIVGSDSNYEVHGNLTMHGVTKQVSIPFKITQMSAKKVAISMSWSLNRKEFGVGNNFKHTSMKNFIADDIGVEIDFWTRRSRDQGN